MDAPTPARLMLQASCALDMAHRHEREAKRLQAMIDYGRSISMPAGPGIVGDLQASIQCARLEHERAAVLKAEANALLADLTGRDLDAWAKRATLAAFGTAMFIKPWRRRP